MYSKVYLEIINTCNGTCSFCIGTKRTPDMLSLADFKTVVNKLVGITQYIYLHVMGEPLTHPGLTEMIRYATALGFKCAITTNGLLLLELCDSLIASGVYKVSISLHSFEESNAEAHIAYIKGCADFADKASSAGVLTVLRLWNRGYDEGRNDTCLEFLKSRFPFDWSYSERGARIKDKLHLEYGERFEWPSLDADDMGDEVFCYGLKDQFGILCDGTVIPCCLDGDGLISLGNALRDDIEAVLSSERAVAMREGFKTRRATEELCKRCGYARRFDRRGNKKTKNVEKTV